MGKQSPAFLHTKGYWRIAVLLGFGISLLDIFQNIFLPYHQYESGPIGMLSFSVYNLLIYDLIGNPEIPEQAKIFIYIPWQFFFYVLLPPLLSCGIFWLQRIIFMWVYKGFRENL